MKLLYIIIGKLGNLTSGSGLRPNCMYRAFQERGYEVYTLSGHAGRGEGKLRAEDVQKAKAWVEENQPDFCYIESSTYPMIHGCDYGMIRFLHKKKIPTGYFYRDFYRRFPALFPRRSGVGGWLKETYLDFMQWRTDRILKLVDTVYFPSEQCFPYFHYRDMKALPPAGACAFLPKHESSRTCIYVGGVSDFYGYPLMMEAFRLLNQNETRYRLILVCREAEYQKIAKEPAPEWLEVHHASGKELEPLYARADVGLLALRQNPYSDLAVGTKLFQYLSYGIPVLSTDVAAMRDIIESNGFGRVVPNDAQSFAQAVRQMVDDSELLESCRASIEAGMAERNLWVHRVDRIVQDLTEKGTV